MSGTLQITDHAAQRAKQRCGLSRAALERIAPRVLEHGLRHEETKGKLRRYLDGRYLKHGTGNATRVYAEHVWVIDGDELITVLYLPRELRAIAAKQSARRGEGGA